MLGGAVMFHPPFSPHKYSSGIHICFTALVFPLLLAACGGSGTDVAAPPPPAVSVSTPVVREITNWDEYTGRLAAVDTVEVRARVSGYLESVHFRDGQIVNEGDLLFVIDPRPYEAAVLRSKAELESARVQLQLAINDLQRGRGLVQSGAISREEFDTRLQQRRAADANVGAAEAAVRQAELDLGFAQVTAPITGRISRKYVTEGNLVSGGSVSGTLLTTVVSLDPIHVYFDADETSYLSYVRLSRSGVRRSSREVANPVRLQVADEQGFPHRGTMDFVDNRIDLATGTMRGRAIFPNSDLLLIPGLFAKVQLLGKGPYEAILIPEDAIGTDQSRRFVFVVDGQDLVASREVSPGRLINGFRVIEEGLFGDERIIVAGLQRARPGIQVTPEPMELNFDYDESLNEDARSMKAVFEDAMDVEAGEEEAEDVAAGETAGAE